jgi:6-bladed beta-propeller
VSSCTPQARWPALGLVAVLAACGRHPVAPAWPVRVADRLTLDSTPAVDIAGMDPGSTVQFGRVVDAIRLPDGSILVADPATPTVAHVDASGRGEPAWGRKGGGPGEYIYPSRLLRCGRDSVYLMDPAQQRVSVFDLRGRFNRAFRPWPGWFRVACGSHGTMVEEMTPNGAAHGPTAKQPVLRSAIDLANLSGDSVGSLGVFPMGQVRALVPITSVAAAMDRIYVGIGTDPWVSAYRYDGSPIDSIVVARIPGRSTQQQYDAAIDQLVRVVRDSTGREANRRMYARVPMPDRLPAYRGILADPAGDLWVVVSPFGDSVTTVDVVTPGGTPLASLSLPADVDLFEVGADYLLGERDDSTGVQHVIEWRYRRAD